MLNPNVGWLNEQYRYLFFSIVVGEVSWSPKDHGNPSFLMFFALIFFLAPPKIHATILRLSANSVQGARPKVGRGLHAPGRALGGAASGAGEGTSYRDMVPPGTRMRSGLSLVHICFISGLTFFIDVY